jgi:hypothetical protein
MARFFSLPYISEHLYRAKISFTVKDDLHVTERILKTEQK